MKMTGMVAALLTVISVTGCVSSNKESMDDRYEPVAGPSIQIEQTETDLGVIGADQSEVVGEIFFFNNGDKPLVVNKVTGPCNCFKGYTGDKLLQPSEGGVLEVKFDKSKIPAGDVKRQAIIETNDPRNRKATVYFNFTVDRDPQQEQIRLLKSELKYIRQDVQAIRRDMAKLVKAADSGVVKNVPKSRPKPDTTVYDIEIGASAVLGDVDAEVTIVEFSDFECPYCVREYTKLKDILKKYPGKVKLVFKHFPLDMNKKARPVHAAAELAKQQGGGELFWRMHDMIMNEPKKLEPSDLRVHAQALGMDLVKFDQTLSDQDKINALLKDDIAAAKKCNVTGTPSIFINGLRQLDRSVAGYSKRIDQILGEK